MRSACPLCLCPPADRVARRRARVRRHAGESAPPWLSLSAARPPLTAALSSLAWQKADSSTSSVTLPDEINKVSHLLGSRQTISHPRSSPSSACFARSPYCAN